MAKIVDVRLTCLFCCESRGENVPATVVAPQHRGGDDDRPAEWHPVCDDHFDGWYDDTPDDERLPAFRL